MEGKRIRIVTHLTNYHSVAWSLLILAFCHKKAIENGREKQSFPLFRENYSFSLVLYMCTIFVVAE